jgi:hypothetical protein
MYGAPLQFNRSHPKAAGILAGSTAAHGRALAQLRTVGASDRMDELGGR